MLIIAQSGEPEKMGCAAAWRARTATFDIEPDGPRPSFAHLLSTSLSHVLLGNSNRSFTAASSDSDHRARA